MTRSLRVLAISVAIGAQALTVTGSALADPTADRSAAAEDLFQRAKVLLAKREFAPACPMLLESYRLDPAGGTLQNLAVCYEEIGKWASAYARFQELRAISKAGERPRLDRIKLAEEHIAKLEPRISRVVIVMPEAIAGAEVTLDGVKYLQPSWSAGIAVDPGTHEIVVAAPGKQPFRTSVTTANDGVQQQVRVPALADEEKAAPSAAEVQPAERAAFSSSERPPPTNSLRTTGFVVGAAGLGVMVAGGVFGILTATTNGAGKDKCSAAKNPGASRADFDPVSGRCFEGSSAWNDANATKDDARTFANVANVLVPVGAVALGVGVYLVLRKDSPSGTANTASVSRVRVSPSLGGASIEGRF